MSTATTESRVLTGPNPFKINPADEFLATPQLDVPLWSETMFFTVWNPAEGVGVWIHVGTHWEDPTIWHGQVFAYLPGGEDFVADISWGKPTDDRGPCTGAFRAICDEPLKKWTLRYDGVGERSTVTEGSRHLLGTGPAFTRFSFEVELTAAMPIWDLFQATDLKGRDWGGVHHQQTLRSRGNLTVGGVGQWSLDGCSFRDHSVGPRDFGPLGGDHFLGVLFPQSGRSLTTLIMWDRTGHVDLRTASIHDGDKMELIGDVQMTGLEYGVDTPHGLHDSAANPRQFELMLGRREGPLVLPLEVLHTAPETYFDPNIFCNGCAITERDKDPLISAQCAVAITWPDGERGYGNLERTYRLSDLKGLQ